MINFLNKLVYIHINISGREKFYLCALVTYVDTTHITIIDKTKVMVDQEPLVFRRDNVVEIKLSNREPVE